MCGSLLLSKNPVLADCSALLYPGLQASDRACPQQDCQHFIANECQAFISAVHNDYVELSLKAMLIGARATCEFRFRDVASTATQRLYAGSNLYFTE
jgi:hypothetical protein